MINEPEQIRRLYELRTFGIKLGLDRVRALLGSMGSPERSLKFVHVAGTNGKGSVCALLDSVLRASGYRTGIYTSPHLVRLNERMRVNGEAIDQHELLELVAVVDDQVRALPKDMEGITFFEFTTAVALEYFRRHEVEVVVLETGMGGRLDATNIVDPLVSVITRIGLEHTQYLGPDIESIAGEKGGIIKKGRPVVCGDMPGAAIEVLERIAVERGAVLVKASELVSVRRISQNERGQKIRISSGSTEYPSLLLPLLGKHQLENAAIAVAVTETLTERTSFQIEEAAVVKGFRTVKWPARFQVISTEPTVILDGAHNPDAAAALAVTIGELSRGRPVGLVMAMCSDKDTDGFLKALGRTVTRCWATTVENERSLPPDHIAALARQRGWTVETAPIDKAILSAKEWATREGGLVCIAGSLYLAGAVLAMLEGSGSVDGLN